MERMGSDATSDATAIQIADRHGAYPCQKATPGLEVSLD